MRQGRSGGWMLIRHPGVRLDLLADGFAAEEEEVEVFVTLAEEDLIRLEVKPAQDAEAGLVEIAQDRSVGGAPRGSGGGWFPPG